MFLLCWLLVGQLLTAQSTNRLQVNDKAPSISITDVLGNKQNLKSLCKKQKVLLVFLRYAWCPICNVRTHELIEQYADIKKKGYEVVVFYQSPAEQMRAYVEDKKIPYITVSDPERKYYNLYKMEYNAQKVAEDGSKDPNTLAIATKGVTLITPSEMTKYSSDKDDAQVGATLIPGDFLIDQQGYIEQAYYGAFLGDHLPLSDLKPYLLGIKRQH